MKIRYALTKLKDKRQVLRKGRAKREIPIIAVVGYTNAGKCVTVR